MAIRGNFVNWSKRRTIHLSIADRQATYNSCRLCINADAVATSYLAGLHRLFLEAKLAEKDHQTALQEANARAYEMETTCLDPLARHLFFFDLQARATSEIAVADLSDSENR